MSAIAFVRPRLTVDIPAFLVGSLFAYEDLLGVFPALVATRPAWAGPPLNAVALTSERLIAFDRQGVTESTFAVTLSAVTGVSSPDDARSGRLSAVSPAADLHLADLVPEDAVFAQAIVYNAAAGTLYRAGQSEANEP
jgi:hypothetical protein